MWSKIYLKKCCFDSTFYKYSHKLNLQPLPLKKQQHKKTTKQKTEKMSNPYHFPAAWKTFLMLTATFDSKELLFCYCFANRRCTLQPTLSVWHYKVGTLQLLKSPCCSIQTWTLSGTWSPSSEDHSIQTWFENVQCCLGHNNSKKKKKKKLALSNIVISSKRKHRAWNPFCIHLIWYSHFRKNVPMEIKVLHQKGLGYIN